MDSGMDFGLDSGLDSGMNSGMYSGLDSGLDSGMVLAMRPITGNCLKLEGRSKGAAPGRRLQRGRLEGRQIRGTAPRPIWILI